MKLSFIGLSVLLLAAPVAGQTTQSADTAASHTEPFFTSRDAYRAAGFVVGVAVASRFDRKLADWARSSGLQESTTFQDAAAFFNFMGQPAPQIIGIGLYGSGKLFHNDRMQKLGLHGFEAMIMSNIITTTIKGVAGRARPIKTVEESQGPTGEPGQHDPDNFKLFRGFSGGNGYQSFPSGHATTAFAAASAVTAEITQWSKESHWSPTVPIVVGVTLYGGATLVGWARMYSDKHWASDVIAGAAIGTFSGIKVVRYAYRHPNNLIDRTLLSTTIVPSSDGGAVLAWEIKF
ncbi:MAG TPA: phosphatase PAP2 family protein [Longimicrobiales bacterium]|nr:phosphatase PAP2 family protein [Longimicrobiales bacterium]